MKDKATHGVASCLGPKPEDSLILDLVHQNPTSVRLRNAIRGAARDGRLPFEHVSDYLEAGDSAQEILVRSVRNLGRKSAAEVDRLVKIVAFSNPGQFEDETSLNVEALPTSICECFSNKTVNEWFAHSGLSLDVIRALEELEIAEKRLSHLLKNFREIWSTLHRTHGLHRRDLGMARELLGETVRSNLEAMGLTATHAGCAESIVLDGATAGPSEMKEIAQQLRRVLGKVVLHSSAIPEESEATTEKASWDPNSYDGTLRPHDSGVSSGKLANSIAECFSHITAKEFLTCSNAPSKFSVALKKTGFADESLSNLLKRFKVVRSTLRRTFRVDRRDLEMARTCLGETLRSSLQALGFSPTHARCAESIVLDGATVGITLARGIAKELRTACYSEVSVSALTRQEGTSPTRSSDSETLLLSVESCVRLALSLLEHRSSDVIERRFALSGREQTLEEIGKIHRISRERIRQIQTKALRKMRSNTQRLLPKLILSQSREHWQTLAGDCGYVAAFELGSRARETSPYFRLALELCEMELEKWLDSCAHRFAGGWVSQDWGVDEMEAIQKRLEKKLSEVQTPCAVTNLTEGQFTAQERATINLSGLAFFGTYFLRERPTLRIQRALRLHAILSLGHQCKNIIDLLGEYRDLHAEDQCTARDCEIVTGTHKNLFLEVKEGYWFALGESGEVPNDTEAKKGVVPLRAQHKVQKSEKKNERQTIGDSIEAELRVRGPSSISELLKRAPKYLPVGRSVNSVGPVLLTNKDMFCRPLPGVYSLHDQVPSPQDLLASPLRCMLRENQVRAYTFGRRAGEPWGTYPLWLPEAEIAWCAWAREHVGSELFESLLSVVRIEDWPEVPGKETWRELAKARGQFCIHFTPNSEAFAAPNLNRILAACVYVKEHGHLSWISGNQILMRRATEHVSAGLLVVLVALGVLAPDADNWQTPHRPGFAINEKLGLLEEARVRDGMLDWKSNLGQALSAEALSATPRGSWVSPELIRMSLQKERAPASHSAPIPNPLQKLLVERAERKSNSKREQTLLSLSRQSN